MISSKRVSSPYIRSRYDGEKPEKDYVVVVDDEPADG